MRFWRFFEERSFFEKKSIDSTILFGIPEKNYGTQKNGIFGKNEGCNFCFWVFFEGAQGAQGCVQVRRGAQGGADEACLRARGGPMRRGVVDARER